MKKRAIIIAVLSFIIGTALFIYFLATGDFEISEYGLYFVSGAFLINVIMLSLVIEEIVSNKNFKDHKSTLLIMLTNIPVAIFYFYVVMHIIRSRDV